MKFFSSALFVLLVSASVKASDVTVKWVGQFPSEQAGPVVELFNSKYAAQEGFKVEYKYDEKVVAGLLTGTAATEYDLVHMKDAEMLNTVGLNGLVESLNLENTRAWPTQLKDAQERWVALVKRARIIYYNADLVSADEVKTYESLTSAKFKDRLCLRQKKAQYTSGLNSFLLGTWGEEKFTAVAKGWAVNTENVPLLEKDLDHIIAKVETGECLVGIANTYYFTRHLAAKPDSRVKPMLPNQNDIAAHVNIDGVSVLKTSTKVQQTKAFVAWLLTEEAQLLLSDITGKHPANPAVHSAKLDAIFGDINAKLNTSFDINEITNLKARALEIATEQGLK